MQFKVYPDVRRGRMVGRDLLAVVWVFAWVVAGRWVWSQVLRAEVIADKIRDAGKSINSALAGLEGIWNALANAPLIGSLFQVPGTQQHPGDVLIAMSVNVRTDIGWIALGAGLLVAMPPILYVLLTYVPYRWGRMKEMGSALQFVRGAQARGQSEPAKALLAYRALARLSFSELMAVSTDPIGDIQARRYDGLAVAMLEEAGLRAERLMGPGTGRLEAGWPKQLTAGEGAELEAAETE
jgi:hypothetical protein